MRFSEDYIERVREATNIVELIAQYTQLKRSGEGLVGLCPFPNHKEKTPSFSVSEVRQAYFCFGCKRGGNAYTFLRDFQGLSFPESVEYLAHRASIPLPKSDSQENSQERGLPSKDLLYKINRIATNYFAGNLKKCPPGHPVRLYLQKRRLSSKTIDDFHLGFSTESWDGLAGEFKKHGVNIEFGEKLGLVRKRSGERSGHYDLFRQRVMFPILSATGETLGFGARTLGDDQPKYLNSPDTPLFHKGNIFYGMNEALKHVRSEDSVVIVEGYMDYLALHQAGFCNTLATLGTALTHSHARFIGRLTKNVIILFDGDQAGRLAAEKSLPILLAEGLIPKGVSLPDKVDPDEFLFQFGHSALREKFQTAQDLFLVVLGRIMKEYRSHPTDRIKVIDELTTIFSSFSDRRLRDLYIQETAARLNVDPQWLKKSFEESAPLRTKRRFETKKTEHEKSLNYGERRIASSTKIAYDSMGLQENGLIQDLGQLSHRTVSRDQSQQGVGGHKTRVDIPREELWLLNMALASQTHFQNIFSSGVMDQFSSQTVRNLLRRAWDVYRQTPDKFDTLAAFLSTDIEDPGMITQFLDPKLFQNENDKGSNIVSDCIRKVRERHLKARAKELAIQLKDGSNSQALEEFVTAVKSRLSLNNKR